MCKELYIIDYIGNDCTVTQYGQATFDAEQAKNMFSEAVHAYGFDDYYKEDSAVVRNNDNGDSLQLRTVIVTK